MTRAIGLLLLTLTAAPAAAQSIVTRGDIQGTVDWQNIRGGPTETNDDWMNAIAAADVAAGWYWTEHLRTQVDASIGSEGHQFRFEPIADPRGFIGPIRRSIRPQTVGISQQYQFFRNAMFHPHIGAGIMVRADRVTETLPPLLEIDPLTGRLRQVAGSRTEGPTTDVQPSPFIDGGFKAYLSRRAFFVTDARVAFCGGRASGDGGGCHADEIRFRFGFGVDF